ncbi:hypothetical protein [Streptomyces sp. NPDC094468]|uniref:hypothetical protein n=1 Tax=Streptomyces sp. NPDC094468 TaxID=3366066 RepID=UPI003824626B
MSKKQQTAIIMIAAAAGHLYLGKVAKQQAAALGLPVLAVSVVIGALGLALG